MRLPFVLLLLAAAAPAPSAGPAPAGDMPVIRPGPAPSPAIECPPTSRFHAARRDGRLKARRLNELPMADTYAAAYRHIGGCEPPIIVRYGVGEEGR